ncbi:MAG: glycosyltransferase [Clostridium sp.]
MRIAMFTNNYKPFLGGVPISIERLANGLRELGHTVYIFAPSYEGQIEEEYVIRYKSYKKGLIYNKGLVDNKIVIPNVLDYAIESAFSHLDFDIIHVHHPMLIGNIALRLGKKYNIPVTFTYHTRYEQYLHNIKAFNVLEEQYKNEENKYLSKLEGKIISYTKENLVPSYMKRFVNKCELIFAPTNLIRDYLEKVGAESEIQVMPTGLDVNYFNENKEVSNEIRNKYIEDKKYLFCTVSRLTKEKNIEFIIDGVSEIKSRVGDIFNLMVIGDGPLKEELKEKARALGIEKNIKFLNSVSNEAIGDYYRAADMFLFASKSETQGIVLLEAMAAKNPVIAIEATGVADVVKNGVNGYMTKENIGEWSDKVIQVIENVEENGNLKKGAFITAQKYLNSDIAQIAESSYERAIESYYGKAYEIIGDKKYMASAR